MKVCPNGYDYRMRDSPALSAPLGLPWFTKCADEPTLAARRRLNPDERINGDLKQAMEIRVPCRTKDKLRQAATDHMTALEKNPKTIKAFFKGPIVAYVA